MLESIRALVARSNQSLRLTCSRIASLAQKNTRVSNAAEGAAGGDDEEDLFDMVLTTYRPSSPGQTHAEKVRLAARDEVVRRAVQVPTKAGKANIPKKLPSIRNGAANQIVRVISQRAAPPKSPRNDTIQDNEVKKEIKKENRESVPKRLKIISPEKPKRKQMIPKTAVKRTRRFASYAPYASCRASCWSLVGRF